jgi:transcriptional regulator with XRE-family HTH domain
MRTVRQWRDHLDMPQKTVARLAELPAPTISEIEHGKRPLFAGYRRKLARAFQCDPSDIVA